jgi:hypothetical protein
LRSLDPSARTLTFTYKDYADAGRTKALTLAVRAQNNAPSHAQAIKHSKATTERGYLRSSTAPKNNRTPGNAYAQAMKLTTTLATAGSAIPLSSVRAEAQL